MNNWPGLAKEAEQLCAKLKIEDVHTTSKPKTAYAKQLKNACKQMEDSMMKTETAEMKKMRRIRAEDWGLKE